MVALSRSSTVDDMSSASAAEYMGGRLRCASSIVFERVAWAAASISVSLVNAARRAVREETEEAAMHAADSNERAYGLWLWISTNW